MVYLRRLLLSSLVASAVLLVPATQAAPATHAQGLSGHWTYTVIISCVRTPANAGICTFLLGPSSITHFVNVLSADCDPDGDCSYRAFFNATGTAPGAPLVCSPAVFVSVFNGTCHETESGTVALMGPPSLTGLPDFFITDESASYFGNPPLFNVHDPAGPGAYPVDTSVQAVPGFYSTRQNLTLLGLLAPGQPVPAGVSIVVIVTHHS